ncbi:Xaa-His dipeptidase [Clostridium perfringens]|uniref:Xaa-His dipeptidase n=1 Tax=Clostridium perfringens TaxID=1502 RepID=A0AAN5N9E8_CLOPF|nr:Xaa-His dipeptidase [Clostridium perfringens]ASY50471.1 Xaa-His dipeptidase [Clostridium perfringens]AWS24966.1 Xaa-His dipeptidase [Clostridium perfringens]MBO3337994.1 Xaa-His dipeptidase [Clostridium perfringens]MBO3386041.1 Xaa-His dipeptidase [Clostridium perfringens]MBO3398728.1 Xaa-His dipeptidase [Clostridium perfringens]
MGRQNYDEYLENAIDRIKTWVRDGITDKEISEKLGISYSTWKNKKAKNKVIKDAIDEIKDIRNQEVEEALFKNCKGYHYYEEVPTKVKEEVENEKGTILTVEKVVISKVKKWKAADLAAQKYWLNNKKKAVWKEDPNKVEHDKKMLKLKTEEFKSRRIVL